jgi:hypothetical protein
VIACGWCGHATANLDRCTSCGHEDPARPHRQRGSEPPVVDGRIDPTDVRKRLAEATRTLGGNPTIEALAEQLGVSPRTVRRWREMTAR